jgi:hypothetical protein
MNMRGRLNKPKTKPTEQKKPAPDADQSPKKELLQVSFQGILKLLKLHPQFPHCRFVVEFTQCEF